MVFIARATAPILPGWVVSTNTILICDNKTTTLIEKIGKFTKRFVILFGFLYLPVINSAYATHVKYRHPCC